MARVKYENKMFFIFLILILALTAKIIIIIIIKKKKKTTWKCENKPMPATDKDKGLNRRASGDKWDF